MKADKYAHWQIGIACLLVIGVLSPYGLQRTGFAQRVDRQKAPLQSEMVSRVTGPRATLESAITQGATATITLQPINPKTVPSSSYPPGSTIVGYELTLTAGGVRVWAEMLATDWAPQDLRTIQATIDSSWYMGANADCGGFPGNGGDLAPAVVFCVTHDDCRNAVSGLADPCPMGEPSQCQSNFCEPGFQDKCDPQWILSGVVGVSSVDISTLNYRYGASAEPPDVMTDFDPSYFGTLVLDVPGSAKGTYTIGFVTAETFMVDNVAQPIPIAALNPGKITIPCGRCCYGQPDVQCVGGVTQAECDALGPSSAFTAGAVCTGDIAIDCPSPVTVQPGEDLWRTDCGLTMVDFCLNPIPADFFDSGSLPFEGTILLGGQSGAADTRMMRTEAMVFAAELPAVAQTPIQLSFLDLVSCEPITVDFCGGPPQLWDVEVGLSETGQQTGMMTTTKTHANGGTFTADFYVAPKFTFTKVGEPTTVRVLDAGQLGQLPTQLGTTEGAWVHQMTLQGNPPPTNFLPGISEQQNRSAATQCCVPTFHGRLVTPLERDESCARHVAQVGFDVDCSACLKGACCNPANGGCTLAEPAGAQSAQEVCEGSGGTFKGGGTTCADGDSDGLVDVIEMSPECCVLESPADLCSLPTKADDSDTDGDGCLDGDEVANGSDPCNVCDPLVRPVTCGPPEVDVDGNGVPDICEPRGACCDPCAQTCTDNTPRPKCDEPRDWFANILCADLSVSCSASCAAPMQIVLQPDDTQDTDTYIHGGGGPEENWNEGGNTLVIVGRTGSVQLLRGLLIFDLSSIPPDATVLSATLSLYVGFENVEGSGDNLALYRLMMPWVEGIDVHDRTAPGATWHTTDGVTPWGCGGADCAAEANPIGMATVAAVQRNDIPLNTGMVQEWISAAAETTSSAVANNGMLLKHPTETEGGTIEFYSSEHPDPALRPILTLDLLVPQPCPTTPLSDATALNKTRFISFAVPAAATAGAAETALRVNLLSLHHVDPPYTGGVSTPFTLFEGQFQYVGLPTQYVESVSTGTPFYASKLQCDPYYQDWSTISLLHVTGEAIVPSSIYEVQNLAASCAGNETNCTSVSAPLSIVTTRWGDVVEAFQLPTPPATQPDFTDIGALVNKFKSAPGAPIKARALLAGEGARGLINLTPDLGFSHISACVDGFKGLAYPYKPGKCTGAQTTACITDADCGANGPCILCP